VIYRRLNGLLLLWAIVPLPFLYIVIPPFWLTAAGVGTLLVVRPAWRVKLSPAVQNALGVVILVMVIAAGGVRVGPLRPLGQLLLLLVVVRSMLVVDRRSFLRILPALFLVWLVSLTASTHIIVVLYFVLSAAFWWWVGMQVHLLGVGAERADQGRLRSQWLVRPAHAAAASTVALILAVPVFLVMPRLRSPWVAARGGTESVTGFSNRVELSGVGTIRQSQQEALIIRSPDGETIEQSWTRLRATAFERVTEDSWAPRRAGSVARVEDGLVRLHSSSGSLEDTVELTILLQRPDRYLFLPTATVALDSPEPVRIDPAGGVTLARAPDRSLSYSVWVTRGELPRFADPPHGNGPRFKPNPEVLRLARDISSGLTGAADRAEAIEDHLRSNYSYSLQGMARIGPDPVSWFLLQSRQGHCEYFAGGMVALLDALDVPARMVGGYSGGTASADGDEVVVREANAHTWVEVWLGEGNGWQAYDPTPASGLPGFGGTDTGLRLRFAWEWVQASWDRYVLTYGLGEQLQLLTSMGAALDSLTRGISARRAAYLVLVVAATYLLLRLVLRVGPRPSHDRRRRPPAAQVMDWLSRRLRRAGVELPPGATVRRIAQAAGSTWPPVVAGVSELVTLAELELYSPTPGVRQGDVRRLRSDVRRGIRDARGRSGQLSVISHQ
jgi:transglutaminase-like putative cysteine protease